MPAYKGTRQLASRKTREDLKFALSQGLIGLGADNTRVGPKGGKTQAQARAAGIEGYKKAQKEGSKANKHNAALKAKALERRRKKGK